MKPTVIRSLGGAFPSAPKTEAGTIPGMAIEPAAATSRKFRRVKLTAVRMGRLPGGFGLGLPGRGGDHGVVIRLVGMTRLDRAGGPQAIPRTRSIHAGNGSRDTDHEQRPARG